MYPIVLTLTLLEKIKNNSVKNIREQILKSKDLNKNQLQKFLWNNYKNIRIDNNYVDFLTIVKDGEFYYKNVFPKIYKDICNNLNARFFIYENNSEDNTKKILEELESKYNNIFIKTDTKESKDRISNIIDARNSLSIFYKELTLKNGIGGNWLFIFDTDIIFNYKESILPLLQNKKPNTLMELTYSIYSGYSEKLNNIFRKKELNAEEFHFLELMLIYYYDTFALNWGKYYRKNPLRLLTYYMNKIETGFGGLGVIKTVYYLTSFYDKSYKKRTFINEYLGKELYCEHWGFGERLNSMGEMYINKNSQSLWYQERDYKRGEFEEYVKFFIKNKKLNNIL